VVDNELGELGYGVVPWGLHGADRICMSDGVGVMGLECSDGLGWEDRSIPDAAHSFKWK
jgi:hypothetical protein